MLGIKPSVSNQLSSPSGLGCPERQNSTRLGLAVVLLTLLTLCEQPFLRLPVCSALLTLQSHQELCFPQSCRCLGIPAPDREESQVQQKHAACMEKTLLFLPRNHTGGGGEKRKKFLLFYLSPWCLAHPPFYPPNHQGRPKPMSSKNS